jgi:hypothetical protein
VSIGLTELVKRVGLLRFLFGMKVLSSTSAVQPQAAAPASRPGA